MHARLVVLHKNGEREKNNVPNNLCSNFNLILNKIIKEFDSRFVSQKSIRVLLDSLTIQQKEEDVQKKEIPHALKRVPEISLLQFNNQQQRKEEEINTKYNTLIDSSDSDLFIPEPLPLKQPLFTLIHQVV